MYIIVSTVATAAEGQANVRLWMEHYVRIGTLTDNILVIFHEIYIYIFAC